METEPCAEGRKRGKKGGAGKELGGGEQKQAVRGKRERRKLRPSESEQKPDSLNT